MRRLLIRVSWQIHPFRSAAGDGYWQMDAVLAAGLRFR
jgi:hypothetical protein